jgi:hypothetical protein
LAGDKPGDEEDDECQICQGGKTEIPK